MTRVTHCYHWFYNAYFFTEVEDNISALTVILWVVIDTVSYIFDYTHIDSVSGVAVLIYFADLFAFCVFLWDSFICVHLFCVYMLSLYKVLSVIFVHTSCSMFDFLK